MPNAIIPDGARHAKSRGGSGGPLRVGPNFGRCCPASSRTCLRRPCCCSCSTTGLCRRATHLKIARPPTFAAHCGSWEPGVELGALRGCGGRRSEELQPAGVGGDDVPRRAPRLQDDGEARQLPAPLLCVICSSHTINRP